MVLDGYRRSARLQFDIRIVCPLGYHHGHDGVLQVQRRDRHPHFIPLCRRLLRRPPRLGPAIRGLRSTTRLPHQLYLLHGLPGRLRAFEEYWVHLGLPLPKWMLRGSALDQYGRTDFRYMGFRSSRTGDEPFRSCSICWTIRRPHRCGFHTRDGDGTSSLIELHNGMTANNELRTGGGCTGS